MPEDYDQRRERCMLDQSSSVGPSLFSIIRSPVELQTRYAPDHPDIQELIASFNELAGLEDLIVQRSGRERLAERAEELQKEYTDQHLSGLAELLGLLADLLIGASPLHPVQVLPSLHRE